ncbi:M28 family metallopeptidase [Methanoculleus sp. MH98A]|uniref:M28 family metallopeptidase n=1 Tax=Methanoculleus sp. MH98A TaxID=1495314 RepID=UPI00049ED1BD|nr:M28 family metallopeptidase [Methanoculleus sp. MH98A]KDE56598.1 peptidase M28 [Methanoculleus sp. MH98A]
MERDSAHWNYTRRHARAPGGPLYVLLLAGVAVLLAAAPAAATGTPGGEYDPGIAAMLAEIDESELRDTTHDLQNFSTRAYGTDGNREAGAYLSARLAAIPGLEVKSMDGELNNIVATLPGSVEASDGVVMVGAHYDSTSTDLTRAPGATDNGCGVAIVLELARVMSGHSFNRTVQFAFWNAEEVGRLGSIDYAADAAVPVALYLNYDSSCYDPLNRSVLDIVYDERSAGIAALMADHNTLYGTNFALTENIHSCTSDHISFRERGYPAVTTHCEEHGPAHTPDDTVDRVSLGYAKRNAQLGLSVLAEVAGFRDEGAGAAIPKAPMAVWDLSGRLDGAD